MPETCVIVGASLAVHFFSPRPFLLPYSPKCVEEEFSELRLYGVLRSSPIEEPEPLQRVRGPDPAAIRIMCEIPGCDYGPASSSRASS